MRLPVVGTATVDLMDQTTLQERGNTQIRYVATTTAGLRLGHSWNWMHRPPLPPAPNGSEEVTHIVPN